MTDTATWGLVECDVGADPALLGQLIRGEVAVVRLRELLPPQDFDLARDRLPDLVAEARTTRYVNGALTTVGPYLNKYLDRPDDYFTEAERAEALFRRAGFDLADRVRTALAKAFALRTMEPATEPDGRRYGPAVLRVHADGVSNPLHNDNIMRDAADTGLSLAGLAAQLSCVVCVQECDTGGELMIYDRPWRPEDERHKVDRGLGYDHMVVADARRLIFRPRSHDVYLINPTHYHEIERVGGASRITLGFFIGFHDTRPPTDAVVWG
jgi:hypothetical protein